MPYDESYFRGGVYADYLSSRAAIRRNARRVLSDLGAIANGRGLLDVGCAAGFFLEAARDAGWQVQGLEVSDYASRVAREHLGLPVLTGSIESLPPPGLGLYDAVTLWDTIEHLERPDLALRNIRDLLREDGILALSTGDYDCLLRRVLGHRWRLFSDPTHLFFFSQSTLERLLRASGFEVVQINYRGKYVPLAMVLHQSPLPLARLLSKALAHHGVAVPANLWDVMTVVARRAESRGVAG